MRRANPPASRYVGSSHAQLSDEQHLASTRSMNQRRRSVDKYRQ